MTMPAPDGGWRLRPHPPAIRGTGCPGWGEMPRFPRRRGVQMTSPLDVLTPRERAVAQEVLRGKRLDLVADDLGLSARTVETHIRNAYRKLGVTSRAEFAAAHPERVSGLLVYGASLPNTPDKAERAQQMMSLVDVGYGTGLVAGSLWPTMTRTPEGRAWLARLERYCVSRTQVQSILRGNLEIDSRLPLPRIDVPMTIVHGVNDPAIPYSDGLALATAFPEAKFVSIHAEDHVPWGEVDF